MTPALQALLQACDEAMPTHRLQYIRDLQAQLVGICQTTNDISIVWREARKVYEKARQMLPPDIAARFTPLATLKEDAGHLDYTRLGAHISHIGKEVT